MMDDQRFLLASIIVALADICIYISTDIYVYKCADIRISCGIRISCAGEEDDGRSEAAPRAHDRGSRTEIQLTFEYMYALIHV